MIMIGEHAVVLGASMGGLLAARVLADFYETVTVVERDVLPEVAENRRGVPQGRHVHALLGRGSQVLGELFPGFHDELVSAGVPVFDFTDLSQVFFSIAGHKWVASGRYRDIPPAFCPSRPLLEQRLRRRIRQTPNITILEAHDVVELTTTATHDRITGARICPRDGGAERVLASDLIVDASGRAARTPAFLDRLGYGRPPEDHVGVQLVYSSQLLRIPPGTLKERWVLVSPKPGRPTGMGLIGYEDDTWMLTVFGMAGLRAAQRASRDVRFR